MRGCVGALPSLWNGRLVGRNHDASGRRRGCDEPKSGCFTAVGEEATPRSQHQRVNQEYVLVDEVVPHQRLDQLSAAHHQEILAWLLLERGYGLCGITRQERGVAPRERLRERR